MMCKSSNELALLAKLGIIAMSLTVSACQDATELSESNIREALQEEVDFLACSDLNPDSFRDAQGTRYGNPQPGMQPRPVTVVDTYTGVGYNIRVPSALTYWEGLVEAGVAKELNREKDSNGHQWITIDLKDEYKRFFKTREEVRNDQVYIKPYVCLGDAEITNIHNYTMPSEGGPQITMVDFSWSTDGEMGPPDALLELARRDPKAEGRTTIPLTLTNEGWAPLNTRK